MMLDMETMTLDHDEMDTNDDHVDMLVGSAMKPTQGVRFVGFWP